MIKKLNILLLVAVALLCAAKMAKKASVGTSVAEATAPSSAEVRNADFAPTVHYFVIPELAMDNPFTNRRGYILDILRAIFPKARFDGMKVPDLAELKRLMASGPDHAIVFARQHAEDLGYAVSKTVLYSQSMVVYTRRENTWAYSGVDSLKALKLGVREAVYAFPEIKALLSPLGDHVRVYKKGESGYERFADAVMSNEVDGFLLQRQGSRFSENETCGNAGDMMMNLRASKSVCEIPVILAVSKADPDYAKKLLAAFEKGYREIEKSGELRRIREYYARPSGR